MIPVHTTKPSPHSGSGSLAYQWYSNTKSSIKGAAEISGATDSAYTTMPMAAGVTYYYCIVTNKDSTMSGSATAPIRERGRKNVEQRNPNRKI